MKIIPNYKKLSLSTPFVVTGTKKELLKFEDVLKYNGFSDRVSWNSIMRKDPDAIYICAYKHISGYSCHNHRCGLDPINVKKFL